jgi:hypothetical protein
VSKILLTSASNHVPSMYQSCINYSSTITHQDVPTSSTIHLMYVPTHQLLVSTMYPTCTSTKIHHQFHHPNMIFHSVIDLVYVGHYNCLIDSNNQVIHKLSTQGSLFISKITTHCICSIPKAT